MYLYKQNGLTGARFSGLYISLNSIIFQWFNFWNILNILILNPNTWIVIIKCDGHNALKFGTIYNNSGNIGTQKVFFIIFFFKGYFLKNRSILTSSYEKNIIIHNNT